MSPARPVLFRLSKEEAHFLQAELSYRALSSETGTWGELEERLTQALELSLIHLSLTQGEALRRAYRLDPSPARDLRPRTRSALVMRGLLTTEGHITPLGRLYYEERKP